MLLLLLLLMSAALLPAQPVIPTSGLIVQHRITTGSGTTVVDSSGQGNDGTFCASASEPTWQTVSGETTLRLDGNDCYSLPNVVTSGDRTFILVATRDATGVESRILTSSDAPGVILFFGAASISNIHQGPFNSSNSSVTHSATGDTGWHAISGHAQTDELAIGLDADIELDSPAPSGSPDLATFRTVGANNLGGAFGMTGNIAYFLLYNRVLSQAEYNEAVCAIRDVEKPGLGLPDIGTAPNDCATLFPTAAVTELKITENGDHHAHFEWTVGAAGASQVEYATTSAGVETPQFATSSIGSDGGLNVHVNAMGFAPGQTYFMRPVTVGNSGIDPCGAPCTNCGSGDESFFADNSGLDCSTGEYPRWTTAAEAGPQTPTAPTHDSQQTAPWPITGSTFVATCATLQTQMDSAAAQALSDGLTHLVTVPPASTEVCSLKPTLAANGSGRVVVQSSADPLLLPKAGVQVDPVHRQHLAKIQYPVSTVDWLGRAVRPLLSAPAATSGWRFIGVEFALPDHTTMPLRQVDVSGIAGDVITTVAPHDFLDFEYVYLELPGFDYALPAAVTGLKGSNGVVCIVMNATSTTFRCPGWTFTGYTTGGRVTAAHPSAAITSCTNTTPITCTVSKHGIGQQPAVSITAISNSVLTIPNFVSAKQTQSIKVEGSPSGTWDGVDWITSVATDDYTLNGSYTGTCPGPTGCGTATRVLVGQIQGTGNSSIDGTQLFTVIDGDTIRLENTTAAGATTGGYFSFDPAHVNRIIDLTNISQISFDRVYFNVGGFPWRLFNFIGGGANGLSVMNSWVEGNSFWSINNPQSNYFSSESNQQDFDRASRFLGLESGSVDDVQFLNTTLRRASGQPMFFGESGAGATDVTLQQIRFHRPDSMTSGKTGSEGPYYMQANVVELKSGERFVYRGNWVYGNQHGGFIARAPVLNLSPRQSTGRPLTDFDAQWNVNDRSGGVGIVIGSGAKTDVHVPIMERVRYSNNLERDYDYTDMLTNSPTIGGGNATGGYPVVLEWPCEWCVFDNNIWYLNRAKGPFIGTFDRSRLVGGSWQNNIQIESRGDQAQPWSSLFTTGAMPFTPYTVGTAGVSIDVTYRQEPNTDPATTVSGNVLIGGIKNPQTNFDSKRDSSAAGDTVSAAEVTTEWGSYAAAQLIPDASTMRAREELVFGSDTDWVREPPYASKGMDINTLRNEQGEIRNVTVTSPAASQVQIAYTAPSSVGCTVRISTDLNWATAGAITEQVAAGGASQSVTFTVTLGQKYAFSIGCPGGPPVRNNFTLN